MLHVAVRTFHALKTVFILHTDMEHIRERISRCKAWNMCHGSGIKMLSCKRLKVNDSIWSKQSRESTSEASYDRATFHAGCKRVERILLLYVSLHIANAILLGLSRDICSPSRISRCNSFRFVPVYCGVRRCWATVCLTAACGRRKREKWEEGSKCRKFIFHSKTPRPLCLRTSHMHVRVIDLNMCTWLMVERRSSSSPVIIKMCRFHGG